MANSSSTATHGKLPAGQVCTYEDWQDIKELFAKAAEQYNGKLAPNTPQLMFSVPALPHSVTHTFILLPKIQPQKRMRSR